MAAVLQPQASMATGLGSSLISRRTAGNNLPGPLELPVNTLAAKFGNPISSSILPTVVNNHHTQSNINALLTPPSNIPGDNVSPISTGANAAPNPAAIGITPYPQSGAYYTAPQAYPISTGAAQPHTHAWHQNLQNNSRGRFSPSLASLMRNPSTGAPTDALPPPSYDLGALPPFPNTLIQTGPVSPPQQPSGSLAYNMTSQGPSSQQSPVTAQDPYMQKLPPTPSYYQSMTPQQSHFPQYSAGSPSIQSPLSASTPGSRISPISQPMSGFNRPYSSISMQSIPSPGHMPQNYGSPSFHQQPIFNSGHAAQMHYGPQAGQPPLDRPFKCDQCPQSFNRNHDLKRHKRIHLAVKPFPCTHCDKSFSRKDALKRHILVKGCGKSSDIKSDGTKDESSSGEQSPVNSGR